MKVLVTGYACDPYKGSEPGVGWRAVCRIARHHQVFVLTDIHNREGWERAEKEGIIPPGIEVRFLRRTSRCSENRWIAHLQSWMNCASFNRVVLDAALSWHSEENFDLCHQVTVAGWRMPSPLWRLPIPFVWGPIGGAGHIPKSFRSMLSPSARLLEWMRDANTWWVSRSTAFRDCMRETSVVFAANGETEEFLRPFRNNRRLVRLPIASIPRETVDRFKRSAPPPDENSPLKLFAGGNMEGRKGLSLALQSLAILKSKGVQFHYTIAGGGPDLPAAQALCSKLGLDAMVEFHPGYTGADYVAALHRSDIYFLPSFRESTPVTLLEALLAGCYPVVADTSAQGEIVRMAGGSAVVVKTIPQLVDDLANELQWCSSHRAEMKSLAAQSADKIADAFSSERYDLAIADAYRC